MIVLVTGGTGFVGRNVLHELHAAGHDIRLLARSAASRQTQELAASHRAEIRNGDVLNRESVTRACAGTDAVIHLVGIISEAGDQTFERVHIEGTRNVVAAVEQNAVRRLIHMSALGTRPDAVARYHRSKWAAEEIVRQSGTDWTIFRPSIIYGPGDGFVNLFAKIARHSPIVPIIGNGESKFQPVAVENVGKAFVRALAEPGAIGQTLNLAGHEVFTMNQIIREILTVMRRRRLIIHLPLALARLQAGLFELLFAKLLHKAPPLNRDQVSMLEEDNIGDGKPADALFALSHPAFLEGIAHYLAPS